MFIELIDLLRCPVDHEDSQLVAAFTKTEGRFVLEGRLGCPMCHAGYAIVNGVAEFSPRAAAPGMPPADTDDPIRFAALLGLTRPGATIVIEGPEADCAPTIAAMTECRVIVVNTPSSLRESERVGVITAGERMPVAPASVDGFLASSGDAARFQEAARILRPGGRIVAPADSAVAPPFRELARDERHVVAEAVGPLIGLARSLATRRRADR